MSSIPRLNIVVVGAGLSGLSAAISCSLSGHDVTVLESAKNLEEVGAGLQITPNASRLFQTWGVAKELEALAAEPTSLTVHRYSDETILAHDGEFNKRIRKLYGAPFLDLHRVDVQQTLARRAQELGVKIELDARVQSIDFDIPQILTTRGLKYDADLIIGADGLWSKCRECFLRTKDPPLPTGDLAYRIVLTLDQLDDPELREWISKPAVHFWVGPYAHAVAYSLHGGKMYNIVLLAPDDLPEKVSKQAGSVEEMQKFFQGWDPILTRFLGSVDSVTKWKLMHREPLDSWVNEKANFALIGDSCHPMLPYLAQGANSSLEDGAVLGLLLGNLSSRFQLRDALRIFQQLRKDRGEAIARETFKQRQAFHMPDGPEQIARDQVFLSQLGKEIKGEFPSRWTCPVVQPWLYGYDAEKEVAAALQSLHSSSALARDAACCSTREESWREQFLYRTLQQGNATISKGPN